MLLLLIPPPYSPPAEGPAARLSVPAAPRLQRRGPLLPFPGRVQRLLGQGAAADEVRTPCVQRGTRR